MNRYTETLASAVRQAERERRGWCFVQCVAGEQIEVATCLGQLLGLPVAAVSDDLEPFNECVVHLVPQQPAAIRDAALSSINGRRDRLSDRGRFILVASRSELAPLQRHAADIFSVLRFAEEVPLVPRALSAEEQLQARQQLADWYRDRFGRLDLRGFVRSETEDASFAVEEIFEPLEATELTGMEESWRADAQAGSSDVAESASEKSSRSAESALAKELVQAQAIGWPLLHLLENSPAPCLILGAPGSGKSFFLRWYALRMSAASEEKFSVRGGRVLPVLISLAAVGLMPGQPPLADYALEMLLSEGLLAGHLLSAAAEEGRVLFLLDGLDETITPRAAWAAVSELDRRYPRSRLLVTSRPGVRGELSFAPPQGVASRVLMLSSLSPNAIHALLVRWCELYELHREGTLVAKQRGHVLGEALAKQVQGSPPVRELATSPLLVTVIAIVHRAGVRLPDRRVELYEHALKILIERWNQARNREIYVPVVPLRLADAVRLLGPVALEMIESDREGAIDAESLETLLRRSLEKGQVRGLADAPLAMQLFRTSLGLLVEKAPDVYGFLHQTFVEFLAAHELVRTGQFLGLLKSQRAFAPKWHEVVLLGIGILGVLHANDEGLEVAVKALVRNAQQKSNTSAEVPKLLGALLADDPSLSTGLAKALLEELVPRWWFGGKYRHPIDARESAVNAGQAFERISQGPWHAMTKYRVEEFYADGIDFISKSYVRSVRFHVIRALDLLGIEAARLVCDAFFMFRGAGLELLFEARVEFDWGAGSEGLGKLSLAGTVRLGTGMRTLLHHTWRTELWSIEMGKISEHSVTLRGVSFLDGEVSILIEILGSIGGGELPREGRLLMWSAGTPQEYDAASEHVLAAYRELHSDSSPPSGEL